MELEQLQFGQVVALGADRYQVIRRWDGANVQVVNIKNATLRTLLRYSADGTVVASMRPTAVGLSWPQVRTSEPRLQLQHPEYQR